MNILTLGLNHNTAPLSLREKVAFGPTELSDSINAILSTLGKPEHGGIKEVAILSTCNRTEIYSAVENIDLAINSLQNFLASNKNVNIAELEEHLYSHTQEQAVQHAFRVASGLDSMVLGETQIVGQMKKAVQTAKENKGLGLFLNQLFQKTFAVAKEVRSTTEIGAHSVSLAAAAVRVANRIFGDLSKSKVLFVGAGEMIELCAAHFCAQKPLSVTVANRTVARAQSLADSIGAQTAKLSDLPEILSDFDIVISCTASSLPIIGLGMINTAIKKRKFRPMFLVDLAVPRDIEPEVSELDEVYVYTVDDLGKVVQSGIKGRQAAVASAEILIDSRVKDFHNWMLARDSVPHILRLQQRAEALKEMELAKAKKAIAKGEDPQKVLERLSDSLMRKYLHDPLTIFRNTKQLNDQEYQEVLQLLQSFYFYHSH